MTFLESIEVASHQELLILALAQLLDNAFKSSPPHTAVQIRLESRDGSAHVRAKNQGGFIAPGERERIFERFYRGASGSRVASGTGLGLYVAWKIANAHAGSLHLEEDGITSEATFCLRLPTLRAESKRAVEAS